MSAAASLRCLQAIHSNYLGALTSGWLISALVRCSPFWPGPAEFAAPPELQAGSMKALRKWNSGRGRDMGSGAQLESQTSAPAGSLAGMQPGAQLRTAPHTPRPLSGRDESHVAQLAAMENYAGHGMYVDVPDAEARALEEAALRYAMEQSQQEAAARWVPWCWCGTSCGFLEAVAAAGCCQLCFLQPHQCCAF